MHCLPLQEVQPLFGQKADYEVGNDNITYSFLDFYILFPLFLLVFENFTQYIYFSIHLFPLLLPDL